MSFCRYGNEQKIGKGVYYICSRTNYPCKFARWCASEKKYKPNANFHTCGIRVRVDKEPPIVLPVEPIKTDEVVEANDVLTIEENLVIAQPKRRKKKKVVDEVETNSAITELFEPE